MARIKMRPFEKLAVLSIKYNRIVQHVIEGKCACCMISASKGGWYYDLKNMTSGMNDNQKEQFIKAQNNKRRNELATKIKALGYGYFPILGHYYETNSVTKKSELSVEKSFFVIDNKDNDKIFKRDMMKLAAEFDQEMIVYRSPNATLELLVTIPFTSNDNKNYSVGESIILPTKIKRLYQKDIDKAIEEMLKNSEEINFPYSKTKDKKTMYKIG